MHSDWQSCALHSWGTSSPLLAYGKAPINKIGQPMQLIVHPGQSANAKLRGNLAVDRIMIVS